MDIFPGERVGRALLEFEFDAPDQHEHFTQVLESAKDSYRSYERVSETVIHRILGNDSLHHTTLDQLRHEADRPVRGEVKQATFAC